MQSETINGFVLLKKVYNENDITIVFPCIKPCVPYLAVSLQSLIRVRDPKLCYDVIIMEDDFDDIDYSRIYAIGKNIPGISIRIISVNYGYRLQFVNFDENLEYEDGISLFLPYILKRYKKAFCIKSGTILKKGFENINNEQKENSCYVNQSKFLAVYYDLEYSRETFTVSAIADVGIPCSVIDSMKKVYRNMKFIHGNLFFESARNEGGKYTEEFIKYAKDTVFYEALIYLENKEVKHHPRCKALFYLFPFEKIRQGSDIVLYGAGNVGKQYLNQIKLSGYCNVVAVVDKKYKWYQLHGKNVKAPSDLKNIDYDYLIISIASKKGMMEIQKELELLGIDGDRIILQPEREIYVKQ